MKISPLRVYFSDKSLHPVGDKAYEPLRLSQSISIIVNYKWCNFRYSCKPFYIYWSPPDASGCFFLIFLFALIWFTFSKQYFSSLRVNACEYIIHIHVQWYHKIWNITVRCFLSNRNLLLSARAAFLFLESSIQPPIRYFWIPPFLPRCSKRSILWPFFQSPFISLQLLSLYSFFDFLLFGTIIVHNVLSIWIFFIQKTNGIPEQRLFKCYHAINISKMHLFVNLQLGVSPVTDT